MLELSQQTESLARRLAEENNLSVDDLVRFALEASVTGEMSPPDPQLSPADREARRAAIDRAIAAIAALPEFDERSSNEIMDDLDPL